MPTYLYSASEVLFLFSFFLFLLCLLNHFISPHLLEGNCTIFSFIYYFSLFFWSDLFPFFIWDISILNSCHGLICYSGLPFAPIFWSLISPLPRTRDTLVTLPTLEPSIIYFLLPCSRFKWFNAATFFINLL